MMNQQNKNWLERFREEFKPHIRGVVLVAELEAFIAEVEKETEERVRKEYEELCNHATNEKMVGYGGVSGDKPLYADICVKCQRQVDEVHG